MGISNTKSSFGVEQWCDYVLGMVEPAAMPRMDAALARSRTARRTVELFERVAALARTDQEAEVPAYAVRVAKAVASLGRPRRESAPTSLLRFLPWRVTFESRQASLAGTRDLPPFDRQITSFRAPGWCVHVKLDQETSPHSQVMVGQLLHQGPEPRPAPEVPVLVLSRGRVVGRSLTSRFGEFQAEDLPPEPLELCLLVGPEECIDIPLAAHIQEA